MPTEEVVETPAKNTIEKPDKPYKDVRAFLKTEEVSILKHKNY